MKHYRKNGMLDRRFAVNKTLQATEHAFWQRYGTLICSIILGLLAGIILGKTLWDINNPTKTLLRPLSDKIIPKVEEVKAVEPLTWNNAIRQVFPEDEAGRMIRICLREVRGYKGDPRYALNNKNKNGSWDYGWCQVNSCHKPKTMTDSEWKTYLEDPMNHAKEVRRIFLSQWWNAWSVYNKGLVK